MRLEFVDVNLTLRMNDLFTARPSDSLSQVISAPLSHFVTLQTLNNYFSLFAHNYGQIMHDHPVQGDTIGCRTGNGGKLNTS